MKIFFKILIYAALFSNIFFYTQTWLYIDLDQEKAFWVMTNVDMIHEVILVHIKLTIKVGT